MNTQNAFKELLSNAFEKEQVYIFEYDEEKHMRLEWEEWKNKGIEISREEEGCRNTGKNLGFQV